MTPEPTVSNAWHFWHQAAASIEKVQEEMQRLATLVSEERPIEIPRHVTADIRRNIARFSEKFDLLVSEQKRRARKGASNGQAR